MKRPTITVHVYRAGVVVHAETRGAFNAGIRASEAAVRGIARKEERVYEGERPEREGDRYTRRWRSGDRELLAEIIRVGPES